MRQYYLLVLCIFLVNLVCAQTLVSGKLLSKSNTEPITYANITITKPSDQKAILAYTITDSIGNFKLNINSQLDSLQINFSHISYSSQHLIFFNKSHKINFFLEESSLRLKELTIQGDKKIVQSGDTIIYDVDSFMNESDVVIADVLRRLPGIEIEDSGTILYQGKPINKYYIEGLDLLEGRYSLANNNLAASDVSKIEVLENHQPIRILDSLTFTDKAAINIKLKNSTAILGTGDIGIGTYPLLRDINLTPMIFRPEYQILTSYQTNNIGANLSDQLDKLTITNIEKRLNRINNWVSIQNSRKPPIAPQVWLNNDVHMASLNYLTKIRKGYQLKVDFNYLIDEQDFLSQNRTVFLSNLDTIMINEDNRNKMNVETISGKVTIEKNIDSQFLKNELDFKKQWEVNNQFLNNQNVLYNVRDNKPHQIISNKLNYLFKAGKKLINLKSYLYYFQNDQNLYVTPGTFYDLFNNGRDYDDIKQEVSHEKFNTITELSFTKGIGKFVLTPLVEISSNHQNLFTGITTSNDDSVDVDLLSNDFRNNLFYRRIQARSQLGILFRNESWVLKFNAPMIFNGINIKEHYSLEGEDFNRVTFEPSISLTKKVKRGLQISILTNRKYHYGNIDNQYPGYVLRDYRTITSNSPYILTDKQYNSSINIEFKEPISGLFSYFSFYHTIGFKNLILKRTVNSTGSSNVQVLEISNNYYSQNLNFRISKYLNFFSSNLTFNTYYNKYSTEAIFNDQLTDFVNTDITLKPTIFTDIAKWMVSDFSLELTNYLNHNDKQPVNNSTSQSYQLKLIAFLSKKQILEIKGEYFKNNIFDFSNNYFVNLNYRYTVPNRNINLQLSWINIMNRSSYTTISNNENISTVNQIELRPSQILLNIKFGFH